MANKSTRPYSQQDILLHKLIQDLSSGSATTAKRSNLAATHKLGGSNKIKVYKVSPPLHEPLLISNLLSFTPRQAIKLYKSFLNIENHKISALVPEVRLYLVNPRDPKVVIPFYFPVSADYNIEDASGRIQSKMGSNGASMSPFTSQAATIDQFSITLRGNNLFEIGTKQLDANLVITVDNLSVLFEGQPPGFAALADLFMIRTSASRQLQGANRPAAGNALSSGTSLQVVATLRYSAHNQGGIFSSDELEAITSSMLVINLFYGGQHNISIQEDGSARVSVSYNGFLGSTKNDQRFDLAKGINASTKSAIRRARLLAGQGTRVSTPNINKSNAKKSKKAPPEPADQVDFFSKNLVFKKTIETLYNNEMVKVLETTSSKPHLKSYLSKASTQPPGPTQQGPSALTPPTTSPKKHVEAFGFAKAFGNYRMGVINKKRFINYVYFGDFVGAAMATVQEIGELKSAAIESEIKTLKATNPRTAEQNTKLEDLTNASSQFPEMLTLLNKRAILTGNIDLSIMEGGDTHRINIADIPISLSQICTTFYREVSNQRTTEYDLSELIGQFLLAVINNALVGRSGINLLNSSSVKLVQTNGPKISSKSASVNTMNIKRNKASVKNNMTYYIFSQNGNPRQNALGSGALKDDVRKGIMHLNLSKDRGLVKTINFTQIPIQGKKEYHVAKDGDLFDELRLPTDATVEMYGNNLFAPGMSVYINPSSIGFGDPRDLDSPAARLGLGGYYIVLTVAHSFSSNGTLNTTLNCRYFGPASKKGKGINSAAAKAADAAANQATQRAAQTISQSGKTP